MMKYDDLYFASRYNFFTDCVEWYFLPKTEKKVFLKKMDIRGFGWRPSICNCCIGRDGTRFDSECAFIYSDIMVNISTFTIKPCSVSSNTTVTQIGTSVYSLIQKCCCKFTSTSTRNGDTDASNNDIILFVN